MLRLTDIGSDIMSGPSRVASSAPSANTPSRGTALTGITLMPVSLVLFITAAGLLALGDLLAGLASATLTMPASDNMLTAALWVDFLSTLAGFLAVSVAAWHLVLMRGWPEVLELGGAALASLLVTIGALVTAASGPDRFGAGPVVTAVGIGGWALLTLANAGKWSIREQTVPARGQSDLWLIATIALTVLAVGTGLTSASGGGRGIPIARSVIVVVGFVLLTASLTLARRRGFVSGRGVQTMLAGLVASAAAAVVAAVGYGFAFSPSPSLTTARLGLSLPKFAQLIAWPILGIAAFQRLAQLSLAGVDRARSGDHRSSWPGQHWPPAGAGTRGQSAGWMPQSPSWSPQPPPPRPGDTEANGSEPGPTPCVNCGTELATATRFCPQCGQPIAGLAH
jgi:zinc-ribbon domain